MRAAGVPLVPGTEGVASLAEITIAAVELGFPVLLKATSGGGGKGMRVVNSPGRSSRPPTAPRAPRPRRRSATDPSTSSARSSPPGTSRSRCSATREGGVLTLGERECSIQRRHQKLIEESPSLALTPETREAMEASVERACRQLGYVNAGTFEFLLGPDGAPSFIEVNCRLQVEHPVTEMTTGIDIVREQLRIAAGEPLTHDRPRAALRARDRGQDQRRGSTSRLRAGRRDDHAVPATARPRRARRHGRDRGRRDPSVLRLDDREGDRARRRPAMPRSRARSGRSRSSRSRASRRRATWRSTFSARRSSGEATTRPATLPRWKAACHRCCRR